jgi:hypothetical protein
MQIGKDGNVHVVFSLSFYRKDISRTLMVIQVISRAC